MSVATYVSILREVAQKCNFQAGTLSEMLRDRLVCGVNQDAIQRRLLSEKKLTFDTSLKTAQALEAAMRNAKEMQDTISMTKNGNVGATTAAEQVHQVQPEGSRRARASCYRCGGTNHTSAQCRFIGKPCYKCGKPGHIGRVCRSKPSQQPAGSGQRNSVRVIEASSPEPADPAPEYYMHKVTAPAKPKPLEVLLESVTLVCVYFV